MRVPLNETAVINLNGSGAGTAKVGPISAREVWYPTVASVSANNSPTNQSLCNVSIGDANTIRYVQGTINGSSGDATGQVAGKVVRCGEYVWAVWSGGDANVQARLTVSGEKEI